MKIVLMDRDGTLMKPPADRRVDLPEKVQLFPDTIEALALLAQHDFKVIVITNQTGIAEDRFTKAQYQDITHHFLKLLAPSKIEVLKVFTCPHSRADNCGCRKPKPKMILDAAKEFGFNPEKCYMIGDRQDDIDIAKNSGAKPILVKTGEFMVEGREAVFNADSLYDAAKFIVAN